MLLLGIVKQEVTTFEFEGVDYMRMGKDCYFARFGEDWAPVYNDQLIGKFEKLLSIGEGPELKEQERWACVQPLKNGVINVWDDSLSYMKSDSIKKFVKGTSLTWRQWKRKYGVKCIKVQIKFNKL